MCCTSLKYTFFLNASFYFDPLNFPLVGSDDSLQMIGRVIQQTSESDIDMPKQPNEQPCGTSLEEQNLPLDRATSITPARRSLEGRHLTIG